MEPDQRGGSYASSLLGEITPATGLFQSGGSKNFVIPQPLVRASTLSILLSFSSCKQIKFEKQKMHNTRIKLKSTVLFS